MNKVEVYLFGKIKTNDQIYKDDLIILPNKIFSNWKPKDSHFIIPSDLKEVFDFKPKILIIGTGYFGFVKLSEDVREYCARSKIELIELKNEEAVEKYNSLCEKESNLALAIHLTC